MSHFKIAFFTKVEFKQIFRRKKSKQYINGALPLTRKNHKTKKKKRLTANKILS